jgi:hypothetical protein
MKTRKIIAIGVTAMVFLETVFSRFIRLLKGEQIMDFLAEIGGLNDISMMGLVNIAFVALFSSQKRVHRLPSFDKLLKPYSGSRTFRKWFHLQPCTISLRS